jgi:hypothetical protein
MADQRQPNDNVNKTRSRTANYRYDRTGAAPITGSAVWTSFSSSRPTYPKGAVVTLPGGSTFRKATPYTHQSWEVGSFRPATLGPGIGDSGLTWSASDEGREGSTFISRYPTYRRISVPIDAKNEAVTKALNKIADQKINLGENLATLRQTLNLFTGKTSFLVDRLWAGLRVKSWRKYFYQSARDLSRRGVVDTAASEYLAFVYGLQPLMNDVYEASKLLQHHAGKTLLFKGVGSAQRTEFVGSRSYGVASFSKQTILQWNSNSKTKCTLWARIDPNWQGLRTLNQLGLLNPLGLAWDLVPYSFCVDWVLPIGPVLYAMTAPAGLLFVDGTISFRNSETLELEYGIQAGSWSDTKVSPTTSAIVPIAYEGYSRTTLSSWPLPGLWFDTDPFRGDRALKALALSILALKGAKPPIR